MRFCFLISLKGKMCEIKSYVNAWIIKGYNRLMKTHFININNKVIRRVRAMFYHNICYECKAHFGTKNQIRNFYVIRCPHATLGFFGLYNYVIYHIKKAEERGLEPIVDWQYYPNNSVTNDKHFAKENAWDYYFERMSDVSLNEVYQSKNVWMSSGEYNGSLGEAFEEEELIKSKKIIDKYMKPAQIVQWAFNKRYSEFGMDCEKILGVLCRGTDFFASKPKYHSICPDAEQMIDIIERKMQEWGYYEHIFIATEDKNILSKFKEHYGDRLLINQHTMIDYSGKNWLNELYASIDSESRQRITLEYFVSILLLSECDALIAPLVGGTLGAMRIKGKYDKLYLTELGQYS